MGTTKGFPLHTWQRRVVASPGLDAKAKLVALTLSLYADYRTGSDAFPGLDRLAKDTGLNERSIRRALPLIVSAGFAHCIKSDHSQRARRVADLYTLAHPASLAQAPDTESTDTGLTVHCAPDTESTASDKAPDSQSQSTGHRVHPPIEVPLSNPSHLHHGTAPRVARASSLAETRDPSDLTADAAFTAAHAHLKQVRNSHIYMEMANRQLGPDADFREVIIEAARIHEEKRAG